MKTILRSCLAFTALSVAASFLSAGEPEPTESQAPLARSVERRVTGHPAVPTEMETGAFLGVETSMISETLTDQLNLPRRVGLVIQHISPDSPAQSAMLKAHDILLKIDDQQIIDTYQLAVLIRNHKEGDELTVTYVRGGREATVKATLIQRPLPKLSWESELPSAWAKDLGPERVQGMLSMMSPGAERIVTLPDDEKPETRIFKMNTGNSHVSFDDKEGALDLTVVDGRQTLVARDSKGAVLFSGPVDTPEQRKGLPPGVRERYEHLESQIKVDMSYKLDGDLKDANAKAEVAPQQSSLVRAPHRISIPTLTLL
ncbi:MAG TPA: PDZ domain-containing protein [Opitutaceae bacterium]|jgi:hypothetical protein